MSYLHWGMSMSLRFLLIDDENNVSICKKVNQMKATNIKLWNLPCLKVNGLSSFICKSKRIDEKQ